MTTASTLVQPPLNMSFDTFAPSYEDNNNEQYTDFSTGLYSPLDVDEFGTDFSTVSAPSPHSPLSPTGSAALYSLPQESDWIPWDKIELSPDSDTFKAESFEDSVLSSVPLRIMPLSPAVNPMDLTNPRVDDVLFIPDGINDNQPLFQTQQFPLAARRPQQQPSAAPPPPHQLSRPRAPTAKRQPTQQPTQLNNKRYLRTSNPNNNNSNNNNLKPPPPRPPPPGDSDTPTNAGPKNTAHNMIEKRYRNNLNDKIAALRDSVPALRVMVHRLESSSSSGGQQTGSDEGDEDCMNGDDVGRPEGGVAEDLGGLAPAHKLNKATILGKATEYILHLERRTRSLAKENAALRKRVEGFEMLVMSRGGGEGMWS
ncbi:hypothetical protein NKR19_g3199 [Coniochaeta hoffmannii]|uniref:BHLH domain-containing protein n=1 Tax=Coniochaeta hoffmannii TaxID=91930 RepID=A0AA38RWK6_9PEZI|nr:hypothetical protein NKR19_g3199 [Coniochaeta hoffmannii]